MLLGSGVPAVVAPGSSEQSSGDDDAVGKSDECVVNNGPGGVTVDMGDEEVALEADGGVVLLDYGCTPGDVTITYETGTEIVLSGPVRPEQEIVIGNETATLQPAARGARSQMRTPARPEGQRWVRTGQETHPVDFANRQTTH